jgi:peroxin-12
MSASSISAATELLMTTIEDVGRRPSFFEIYLLESTESMFKPAFRHFFNIIVDRNASAAPFLQNHFDNIYAFVFGILQINSLISDQNATIAEVLYGFRRESSKVTNSESQKSLDTHQKLASIAYIVVLPRVLQILKDSLQKARRDIQAMTENPRTPPEQGTNNSNSFHIAVIRALVYSLRYVTQKINNVKDKAIMFLADHWDTFQTLYDYCLVIFKVSYLFNKSNFHHPLFAQQEMRLIKTRDLHSPMRQNREVTSSGIGTGTSSAAAAASSPTFLLTIALLALKTAHWATTTDFSSHNIRQYLTKPTPPPPFPRPCKVGKGGLIPPKDTSLCPMCRRVRKNSVAASSGYVYCYTCLLPHVREHKKCPVTLLRCTESDIIRLYENGEES